MTKKHQHNFNRYTSGSRSASPITSSSAPSQPVDAPSSPSPKTVNERLNQLRREQTPRPTVQRRDEITTSLTSRTVPPALRRILDIPESAPPLARSRPRGRRVPGPAAPQSWLLASQHAPSPQDRFGSDTNGTTGRDGDFSLISSLDDSLLMLPADSSLTHLTLKTLALNWEFLSELEQHNLPTLPTNLKCLILTYLGAFGTVGSLKITSLRAIFSEEADDDGGPVVYDDVKHFDFGNLLSDELTLAMLNRFLFRPTRLSATANSSTTDALQRLYLEPGASQSTHEVAESWESEAEVLQPSFSSSTAKFGNLTRLSLSNPGLQASWKDLLQLSVHFSKLTHLSLAYWPAPSVTPNATLTSINSRHSGPVHLGGTHVYSALDDDWYEAANILRRLSKNTYCLKWLDLEGCDWPAALSYGAPATASEVMHRHRTTRARQDGFADVSDDAEVGPDWNGAWRQIEYLNLSQGWIPQDTHAITQLPAGKLGCDLLSYLRESDEGNVGRSRAINTSERNVRYWLEREKRARQSAQGIRILRHAAQGKYCKVDHGWNPPVQTIHPDQKRTTEATAS